ncbi:MAG: hypothetical protein NMNS01_04180 [Nitrosomonas sp.]|nr:MAG: hypothetical protein NMNS01_04180 [Nitrosomonas sp.]
MNSPIIQLYPHPVRERPLKGTYLAHNVRRFASGNRAFVYTNFITSLDGRIAVHNESTQEMQIPELIANDRDWWLFQELASQADIIISSGRYLKDWTQGNAQEILQVDDPQFAELRNWRCSNGLSPQADIAIISSSLNFPIPDILTACGRKVVVFTTADPKPERVKAIEKKDIPVIVAGNRKSVNGATMVNKLTELGYRTIFSSAGPKVLHLLLTSHVLDRLYITHTSRILGGNPYASIVEGERLNPAVDFNLTSIYLDPSGTDGLSQLFITYDQP